MLRRLRHVHLKKKRTIRAYSLEKQGTLQYCIGETYFKKLLEDKHFKIVVS